MKVAVLDMTHGGDLIALRYQAEGDDVTCVDVYHNCPADRKDALRDAEVRVCDSLPVGKYDLAVMPGHCPRTFLGDSEVSEIISFSRAVNRFIDDRRFRIEVTGVKGKTSACYLISKILHDSGRKVLLHSSRGEGSWTDDGHSIERMVSIAPPYLMTLPAGDFDVIVSEVSLGGSGKADIALITNLAEDYGIAKNSLKASDAKKDIFTDKVNIVPEDEVPFWSAMCDRLTGYKQRVRPLSQPRLGEGFKVAVDYDGISEIVLDGSYVSTEYLGAMDASLEVCHAMGIPRETVLSSLESFKGVPGRGEIVTEDGRTVIRERNPGISRLSVARVMRCLDEMDALEGAVAILDPVSRKVCDKMDAGGISEEVGRYGVPLLVTDGDGKRPKIPQDVKLVIEFIKEGYQ